MTQVDELVFDQKNWIHFKTLYYSNLFFINLFFVVFFGSWAISTRFDNNLNEYEKN